MPLPHPTATPAPGSAILETCPPGEGMPARVVAMSVNGQMCDT